MKKLIILAGILAFTYACSSDENSSNIVEPQATTTLNCEIEDSRTILNDNTASVINAHWSAGDQIVVFTDAGNKYTFTTQDNDVKTASFTSTQVIPAGETPKYAYYTNDLSGTSETSVPGSISANQKESDFFGVNFGKYDHKVSKEYNAGTKTFKFKQSMAILRFYSKFTNASYNTLLKKIQITKVRIKIDGKNINGSYTADITNTLSQDSFTPVTGTSEVTYDIDESTISALNVVANMFVLPTPEMGDNCTIYVDGKGSGSEFSVKYKGISATYLPGKFYKMIASDKLIDSNKVWVKFPSSIVSLMAMVGKPITKYTVNNSGPDAESYYNLDLVNKATSIMTGLNMFMPSDIEETPAHDGSSIVNLGL